MSDLFAFPTADHLGAHEPSSDPRRDGDPGSPGAGTRTEAKTGAGRGCKPSSRRRPPPWEASTPAWMAHRDRTGGRILLGLWKKPIFKIWIILKVSTELVIILFLFHDLVARFLSRDGTHTARPHPRGKGKS